MAFPCIRNDINYGELGVYEVDGIRFAAEAFRAQLSGLVEIAADELSEFVAEPRLTIEQGNREMAAYVFDKKDLKPLAIALSKLNGYVGVYMNARILASWRAGDIVRDQVTLDHFYSGLDQETIEKSRF